MRGQRGWRRCEWGNLKPIGTMVSISPNRLLVLVQILVVLVVCTSVAHPASAVPHHHEHDRSEVLPPSVYHTIVSDEKHVIKNPPRHAPHRGVHKWRAINSVAHHINEAYGNHDEEVSPEEFGRWYREHRPKVCIHRWPPGDIMYGVEEKTFANEPSLVTGFPCLHHPRFSSVGRSRKEQGTAYRECVYDVI